MEKKKTENKPIEGWEKRFDDRFQILRIIDKAPSKTYNVINLSGEKVGNDLREEEAERVIKQFIKDLLAEKEGT